MTAQAGVPEAGQAEDTAHCMGTCWALPPPTSGTPRPALGSHCLVSPSASVQGAPLTDQSRGKADRGLRVSLAECPLPQPSQEPCTAGDAATVRERGNGDGRGLGGRQRRGFQVVVAQVALPGHCQSLVAGRRAPSAGLVTTVPREELNCILKMV